MPLKVVDIKRGGKTIGFRAVESATGKMKSSFVVGRTTGGKRVSSLADARKRAIAFIQRFNLEMRRAKGQSAPPRPRGG